MSSEQETIIKSDKIKSFAIEALKSTSMSDEDAKTIADTLVESDLKGVIYTAYNFYLDMSVV